MDDQKANAVANLKILCRNNFLKEKVLDGSRMNVPERRTNIGTPKRVILYHFSLYIITKYNYLLLSFKKIKVSINLKYINNLI